MKKELSTQFLDDVLFDYTINYSIDVAFDFRKMMGELYDIAQQRYLAQLYPGITKKDAKAVIDRTFNSWNLYMERLEKHNYMLVDIIKKYPLKEMLMKEPAFKMAYDQL